jgi:hypothetical protein
MKLTINPILFRSFLKTTADAVEFQLVIDKLSDELFKSNLSPEEILTAETAYDKAVAIRMLAQEYKIDLRDKSLLQKFLAEIYNAITTLPVVEMTIAVTPKRTLIRNIHDWFYSNYKKAVLINPVIDQSIIGGSIIRFDGKYKDYSLKQQTALFLETEIN